MVQFVDKADVEREERAQYSEAVHDAGIFSVFVNEDVSIRCVRDVVAGQGTANSGNRLILAYDE
jgi:hypothetical protein